jgi:hypothetical protein
MNTILRGVISLLILIGFVTLFPGTPSNAKASQPSANGSYRLVMEDGLSKSVEFSATSDERGVTTGQMTFRDEARVVVQDVDGVGGHEESSSEVYVAAVLNSLTIDRNRAVMNGTITDSNIQSYIGKWVQLVVEDNGTSEPDKLTWCFCKPEEGGWVPADAEVREDQGAFMQWWATDAERDDDKGVQSTNIIPGTRTSCKVFPLSTYEFAEVRNGEGQIQVQP